VLASNLTAKRTGANYVIEISYKSRNAERAAEVANAFADAYINDEVQQGIEVSKRYREWLLPTINEVGDQLTELQRKISEFKATNNIVEAGDGRTVNEQQLADLSAQQIAARQRLSDAKLKLVRVEELISGNVDGAALEAAVTAEAVKSDVFTTLRTKYLDKRKLERQFSSRVGSTHEVAIRLRSEMEELRSEMHDELKRVAETYRNEVDTAKRVEDNIQHEMTLAQSNSVVANDKLQTLRKLEADYKALQEIYNDKQKEYRTKLQQETFPIPPARVLTKAAPPSAKDYRKFLVGLAVVPAGGLGLGLALAFLLEMMDDVFHTERQVQKTLGVKCLAIVPILKETEHGANSSRTSPGAAASRTILRDQTPLWSVSDSPFSYFAESVRLIKAAADLAGAGAVKVIGLTSAVPNEGKSTIAASLAQAIAQSGSRAILVDCDLRNPSLTASLAPVAERGLVDVISGRAALNDVVWTDPTTGMTFLPTVMKSRVAQTNEILASDATKKLFNTLRLMYDYVIVDLSPLAPVVDVRATANLVDTYVFVVEWGRTHTSVVRRTLESAPTVTDNLLGVVLNKTDMKLLRRYDSHLSKYHEKGYYRY
jgi:succinoglycan biosynthesis transport protein ExoP